MDDGLGSRDGDLAPRPGARVSKAPTGGAGLSAGKLRETKEAAKLAASGRDVEIHVPYTEGELSDSYNQGLYAGQGAVGSRRFRSPHYSRLTCTKEEMTLLTSQ